MNPGSGLGDKLVDEPGIFVGRHEVLWSGRSATCLVEPINLSLPVELWAMSARYCIILGSTMWEKGRWVAEVGKGWTFGSASGKAPPPAVARLTWAGPSSVVDIGARNHVCVSRGIVGMLLVRSR